MFFFGTFRVQKRFVHEATCDLEFSPSRFRPTRPHVRVRSRDARSELLYIIFSAICEIMSEPSVRRRIFTGAISGDRSFQTRDGASDVVTIVSATSESEKSRPQDCRVTLRPFLRSREAFGGS